MGVKPIGLMKEEVNPAVTYPRLKYFETGIGGAVLKGHDT
jgi:hypothetical protein